MLERLTAAARRAARRVLGYQAAEPSRLRQFHRERGKQNELVQRAAAAIRAQARYLIRNHDLARGALRVLVNNIIGPAGIGIEPQPLDRDGKIHAPHAAALRAAWQDWCRAPDVTRRLPWPRLQRALARAWLRDGEAFAQLLIGPVAGLRHPTPVPLSIEAFEADLVPFDLNDQNKRIVQSFELDAWGCPIAIHVAERDPAALAGVRLSAKTRRIPWARALHIANLDHIGQIRGVSEFAAVITRLEDIRDYEDSERIAAKIASRLTAYIKKGNAENYQPPDIGGPPGSLNEPRDNEPRAIELAAGAIIDDLAPGEEVGLVDSKRPNPNLITFRQGQLRAVAAGIGASYSSISRDYNGTYSAQRQELVEQWVHYAVLCDEFTGEIVQPVWEAFVTAAALSGAVPPPPDLAPGTAASALFIAQSMPWIDPKKEADAYAALLAIDAISETEIIRRRGGNPADVLYQIAQWREMAAQQSVDLGARRPQAAPHPGEQETREDTEK
jgi:lambda family phage portal protein